MRAFHNDEAIKAKYVERVKKHIELDHLIRGEGWTGEKGCAVGCTLENYDYTQYPVELGIPEWLARVEDVLFEGMNEEKSRTWPKLFLESITVGVDPDKAKAPFIIKILERNLRSLDACVFDKENNPQVVRVVEGSRAAIITVIDLYRADNFSESARSAAESAAESAGSAAWSAVRSLARSAAESAAESARSAAWSAAESAWSAARSAAAESVRSSARSAAWSAAESAAESAAYDEMADELIDIIKEIQ